MLKLNKYFIPYILVLFLLGFRGEVLISFIIVFIHELVHYITARLLGFSGFVVEIIPIGAVLKVKDLDEASPMEDFIISISGPLFNLLLAWIFYFTSYKFFFISNLSIGLLNFIPALPLDGGRMLRDLLSKKTIYKRANVLTIYVSFFIGYALVFYNLILFCRGNININLCIIALF
ncbi:MAG: M50 family metallopeptidase, partial [Clostridiaceae bacterium]|nr:M50 family metallopeptidase [Clostridiaceae bacterium]